jgi:hypothetical protein
MRPLATGRGTALNTGDRKDVQALRADALPKCGAVMNHHAEKLIYPLNPGEVEQADPALGGVIEEAHHCPNCGNVEFRRGT